MGAPGTTGEGSDVEPPRSRPVVVGIGGTTRHGSSTERVLRIALDRVADLGAETLMFAGPDLCFPHYAGPGERDEPAARLVAALRACDGLILATPSYHGSISGLVKNALDYTEDLRSDPRVYLDGIPVGCICCAGGWQAASHTLGTLRSIVHALRGWPTPVGVLVNTSQPVFAEDGRLIDDAIDGQVRLMAGQVMDFVKAFASARPPAP